MTDDPQAMTAGPRTAEDYLAFKRGELERARDVTCAEREAAAFRDGFAQGIAAARAAVEAVRLLDGFTARHVNEYRRDVLAALDSTDRP